MTFSIEIVLKSRNVGITEQATVSHGEPSSWDDGAVRDVLVEILRAIDRAEHPDTAADRTVVLRGFSWIVEPVDGQVVIALEIPMGAAVAGPFAADATDLTARITRVLAAERQMLAPQTVH